MHFFFFFFLARMLHKRSCVLLGASYQKTQDVSLSHYWLGWFWHFIKVVSTRFLPIILSCFPLLGITMPERGLKGPSTLRKNKPGLALLILLILPILIHKPDLWHILPIMLGMGILFFCQSNYTCNLSNYWLEGF